jgi:lipid A 3-O-deacylase
LFKLGWLVALALSASTLARAADVAPTGNPSTPAAPQLYDPTKFEIRGGYLISPFGPEEGISDVTGALVLPKVISLSGWQDLLVPRIRVGGVGNLGGRTSYAYADALWTANFNRAFAELFFGGLVHNGPLFASANNSTSLGCRELYHMGVDVGYRFDQHWSVIATFEHGSNGEPVWSDCHANRGLNVTGVSLGYSF